MKRLLWVFTLSVAVMTAAAQDTIHSTQLSERYFCGCWNEVISSPQLMGKTINMVPMAKRAFATRFVFGDTLQVYGVAASLSTLDLSVNEWVRYHADGTPYYYVDSSQYRRNLAMMCDTSAYDEAYELFGLYVCEADTDTLRLVSPQMTVNIKTTPVSYYHDLGVVGDGWTNEQVILPVYEMYFDSAVMVSDSFYVGMTCNSYSREDKCQGKRFYTWPIFWNDLFLDPFPPKCERGEAILFFGFEEWRFSNAIAYHYVFPILDTLSGIDTTLHPGDSTDTVGIATAGLERFVKVSPNPASAEVRVVSGVPVSKLEIYDVKGAKVMERSLSGPATTLDVRGWAVGTYLLRLHTPFGVAAKKLMVRRE